MADDLPDGSSNPAQGSEGVSKEETALLFANMRGELSSFMFSSLTAGLQWMEFSFTTGVGAKLARHERDCDVQFQAHSSDIEGLRARIEKLER